MGDPIAVLPVLFHLLWCQEFSADLSTPLHPDTVVTLAGAGPMTLREAAVLRPGMVVDYLLKTDV
jgi:hypothetical protein